MHPLRVLFVANECNPEWTSVPGLAFQLYAALYKRVDNPLVTYGRNRQAHERVGDACRIVFVDESPAAAACYRWVARIATHGRVRWNLLHFLSYPIYAEFHARTFRRLHNVVENGEYDIVHAFTPILPRYPFKIAEACRHVPLIGYDTEGLRGVVGSAGAGWLTPCGKPDELAERIAALDANRTALSDAASRARIRQNADI